jgi:hypothetical protein
MGIYNHYNTPAVVAKPTGRQYIPGKGMVAQAPINRNGILT